MEPSYSWCLHLPRENVDGRIIHDEHQAVKKRQEEEAKAGISSARAACPLAAGHRIEKASLRV